METLTDLLADAKSNVQVQIREDPHKGIYVEGLEEKVNDLLAKLSRE